MNPFPFRRFRVRRQQPAADHPPLVLIHGMTAGPAVWDAVLPLLAATRDVHTVTLPGHRGGAVITDPAAFTSADYVAAVEAELDARGIERADLVGNSLGGWVALQLAARGRATSVVCLAPAGGWRAGGAFDRYLAAQFGVAAGVCRRLDRPRGRRLLARPGVRRALLRSMVARPDLVTAAQAQTVVADIAGCQALRIALNRPEARDIGFTPSIDVPVLIAWSQFDKVLVSHESRRRLERQVGAPEVVRLAGVGHVPMSDDPVLVAETVLEFTERRAGREPERV